MMTMRCLVIVGRCTNNTITCLFHLPQCIKPDRLSCRPRVTLVKPSHCFTFYTFPQTKNTGQKCYDLCFILLFFSFFHYNTTPSSPHSIVVDWSLLLHISQTNNDDNENMITSNFLLFTYEKKATNSQNGVQN